MAITPVPTTRVSDQLNGSRLLAQLRADQTALLRLQQQIASGRRIGFASEDAPAATRAIDLQRLIERKAQVKNNLQINQSYLSATDTALSNVSNLLNESRGVALGASGTTITATQRESAAQEIDRILQQLVDTGNQQFRGRYLFGGSRTGTRPFETAGQNVVFSGNETELLSYSDIDLLFETNVSGARVFGAISQQVPGSVDLNPVLTADTPLATLNGGLGVRLGSIQVADGSFVRTIDLSKARTLGDIEALLEQQPANGTLPPVLDVEIGAHGLTVALPGGGTLEIREVGSGVTARQLGILAPSNLTSEVVGNDLNARLTGATRLDNILGTRALARVVSPGFDNNFFIEANTNGTALNGYTVQFVDSGTISTGNETVSIVGTTITVDIDGGNSTAQNVVDALNADATFAALFTARLDGDEAAGDGPVSLTATATTTGGSGQQFDLAAGLQISNGGVNYTIDLSTAETVEDLLNLVNGSGAAVLAELNAAGTGINIRSRLSGGDFAIGENGGLTATQLGLRTFSLATRLDGLNHSLGMHSRASQGASGDDFAIQLKDGDTLEFRIDGQTTIGDVVDLINNHVDNAGRVVARLATTGNGIELATTQAGATPLAVLRRNGSAAATDLGLLAVGEDTSGTPTTSGGEELLTGRDTNPSETASLFNSLVRLRTALRANDQVGIGRSIDLIDDAATQLNFSRAEIGARQQALDVLQGRLDSETIDLESSLSQEIDVDLAQAISDLSARQAAYEASLQLAGQLFQLSLLDFV